MYNLAFKRDSASELRYDFTYNIYYVCTKYINIVFRVLWLVS